ncbi:mediator complex, subunit Med8 [Aspergillus karnatakaensis]|uniref:RNA polymerase II mediator complex subunit MED8 n=1 Tax=Aspergillus karnatakaensis TaxID=1810916 RepID=UPI003CCD9EDB
MSTPAPDQLKTLEQSRQRLIQLTHSLGSLITSLNNSDPLPSWPSLQSQSSIISSNLQSLSTHLSENHELLRSISAYPAPEFPTKTHGTTLEQLLRTKLDPRVEEWVSRGAKGDVHSLSSVQGAGAGTGMNGNMLGQSGGELSEGDLAALWEWAPVEANAEARRRNWGGNFTLEERERGIQSVVEGLGLTRVLEDDEESEEEEDEDEMDVSGGKGDAVGGTGQEVVKPVVPLDEMLRFMTTGLLPAVR